MLVISARKGEFETGFERGGQVIVFANINSFIGPVTQKKSLFDPDNRIFTKNNGENENYNNREGL